MSLGPRLSASMLGRRRPEELAIAEAGEQHRRNHEEDVDDLTTETIEAKSAIYSPHSKTGDENRERYASKTEH
jgi:hypothetical protein